MKDRTKRIWHIVAVGWAAIAFEVFLALCLGFFADDWARGLYLTALVGGTLLNAALLVFDLVFYFFKKELVYKSCIIAYFLLLSAAVVFYVMLKTGFFEVVQDDGALEAYLQKFGVWMAAIFILIQFLQVVILPIPSTVTVLAGSALFGPLLGSVYSLIGILTGSLVAFFIGRYAGYRVVAWLVGKDTLDKWLQKIKGKDKMLLSAMFLLPVFPDDVLCFVAGLSSMSIWLFFTVIFISRVIAIFMTSYSVSLIPFNTWWGILIWILLAAAVIVLFVFLYKKTDAIENWILKKIRRETRVEQNVQKDEFTLEVVDPDGSVVAKGVKKTDGQNKDRS